MKPADFNSYGSRRGNHEVMVRGTFANIRIRNEMVPGTEGGFTRHIPSVVETLAIFDAAMRYQESGTPLVVIARKSTAPAPAVTGQRKALIFWGESGADGIL